MAKQEEILRHLVENQMLTQEQIVEFKEEAKADKKNIEEILVNKKIISLEDLTKFKATLYGLSYENLQEKAIDKDIINIISKEVAENYKIICFSKDGQKIKVGIIDPDNFKAIEAMDFLAKGNGLEVEYFLVSADSFARAIKKYESISEELSSAIESKESEEEELMTVDDKDKIDLEEITKSAPVAKIVSVIIRHAVEGGASDIHIEPLHSESRVRYRIDGILHTSLVLPRNVHNAIVARIKVMANLKIDETRIPQDGRIRLVINKREIDFRVSILPLVGSEKVVMRILDTTKGAPALLDLGFQGRQLKVVENNLKKTEGLLLVTGPTGSGKSTTLFSMIDILNKEGVNISTLEDPVEYQIKGVNQSQVKPDIGYNFSTGLRSFLRQDPDVIMVGEIRDEETAELAIHAALTGHVVLSTLHTNSAVGAIPRLLDMRIEPFLLGSTVHTVIAQRLARKICPHCKEEFEIPKDILSEVKAKISDIDEKYINKIIKGFNTEKLIFYHGKGCPRCGNSGYSGRVSVIEVLDINKKLKRLIFDGNRDLSMEQILSTQEFITIKQDGILKVLQGITTMEEVMRVMKD
ncbi:Flp pilus assembly complex ATPase component TadA [Candidatus Parcubacteria bacterium]|nr:Flp pilus assembly complex ATPase component TadA [Candidatus Parcubacteria bacterium]